MLYFYFYYKTTDWYILNSQHWKAAAAAARVGGLIYELHFPISIDASFVITHAQTVGATAREAGPAGRTRMFFVGSVGQKKKKEKVPRKPEREEPNVPRCNWKQPYGGGVPWGKLEPGMRFMWLICRLWDFQWAFVAVSGIAGGPRS